MNLKLMIGVVGIVVVAGGIYAVQQAKAPRIDVLQKQEGIVSTAIGEVQTAGTYEPYDSAKLARAAQGKVVLFFRAPWCPTCRALDADIRVNLSAIPQNVTILDVDYDSSTELKQKYGVTYQHTMVQVDAQGNQIAKWTGSPTLSDLLARVQ